MTPRTPAIPAMEREKGLQVGLGNTHRAAETMNRVAAGHAQHLGDILDRVKLQRPGRTTAIAAGTSAIHTIIGTASTRTRFVCAHAGLACDAKPAMNSSTASRGMRRRRPILAERKAPEAKSS